MPRRTTLTLTLAFVLLGSLPLQALEYEIRLTNGNTFQTRYEPVVASFDATKLFFMTNFGNTVAIALDQVTEVISLTDASGFGRRLDRTTIVIGLAPNDNPTPEEEAALAAQGVGFDQPAPFTNPLISEPDQTGGIPLQFLNYTTPPLGGGGSVGGRPADSRRGGGDGQFVEPATRD